MNTKLAITFAASALAFGVQQAKAVSFDAAYDYRDADKIGAPVFPGTPYDGSFNLKTADGTSSFKVLPPYNNITQHEGETYSSQTGFVAPNGPKILMGEMDFWFSDTEGDTFKLTVDGAAFAVTLNGGGPQTFQSYGLNATIILDLQANGEVAYHVENNEAGRVILFDYAALGVVVEKRTTTPDGGTTAMLLGLGSLGVAAVRRKLS